MKYQNQPVAICFVSNIAYMQHLSVTLVSLLIHSAGEHNIFIFSEDITDADLLSIRRMTKKYSANSMLSLIAVDGTQFNQVKGYWPGLGKQVFHRLLIPDLIPEEYSYALYMDADIVVLGEINLPQNVLEGVTIAAVRDSISHILAPKRNMDKYFNAGVMVIDVKRWKAMNAFEKIMQSKPKKTLFAEQEMLNEVFKNDWAELPNTLNYPSQHTTLFVGGYKTKSGEKPVIVHYLGGLKPWKYWVRCSELYWKYLQKTPYPYKKSLVWATIWQSVTHVFKKRFVAKLS